MKISNVEVISFKTMTINHRSKWGFLVLGEPTEVVQTLTKISTDDGAEGYMIGGDPAMTEQWLKPLLVGEDPLDREKLWTWLTQWYTQSPELGVTEMMASIIDCALWDLYGRMVGLPVHKLLGGARDKVKAYASGYPDLGPPEVYAEQALACKERGYTGYKVHAYLGQKRDPNDPSKWIRAPQQPGNPVEEIAVCRAIREAVGPDMVLMHDPFGSFTLEEALWVAEELEKLDYYWLEHPMLETQVEAYRRLTRKTKVHILAPEHIPGGAFARADWIMRGASDMVRIGYIEGGVTGCMKLATVAQAFGIKCEMHGGDWPNIQVLGATNEGVCEWYERGLLELDIDNHEIPPPYLKNIPDFMDDEGYVHIPQTPGLGMEFEWDYINDNLVGASDRSLGFFGIPSK
jgi:L-alanine-DL-glutamate epimerase-like enolase superfamily enzyme